MVEVNARGKAMAERSSGSFVPATLQLAATLRWLASAHFACQEDNYSLGTTTFYLSVWKCVYTLDCALPNDVFDPRDEGSLRALADGMYVRSGRLVPGCIGTIDGMAVHINRPTLKDTAAPLSYKNQKKYYSVNLQAMADWRGARPSSRCCFRRLAFLPGCGSRGMMRTPLQNILFALTQPMHAARTRAKTTLTFFSQDA